MKTYAKSEPAAVHPERQAAGARQAAQLNGPDPTMTGTVAAAALLQGHQQQADNSPQATQLKQRAEMMAASTATVTLQRYAQLASNSPQAMQLKQRVEMMAAGTSSASMRQAQVVQRAAKWWPTDDNHANVTGGPSDKQPDGGSYVKRDKAGSGDELLSTEGEAWSRAKAVSLENRSENTVLFPNTSEKMATGDGNRTYLTKEDSTKAVSIVATHTTDPQSQVQTENGDKLKVTHAHSAIGIHANVKKALKKNEHPAYTNDAESKVHYLSLTLQAG